MKRIVLALATMSLIVLPSLSAMAAESQSASATEQITAEKSFDGFYWETKKDFEVIWGVTLNKDNANFRVMNWVPVGIGLWLGGWHNDVILLGNFSLNAILTDHTPYTSQPLFALGFTFTPVGISLGTDGWFSYKKLDKQNFGVYLKPTYTYLVGLNGNIAHRHAFGIQLSMGWQ